LREVKLNSYKDIKKGGYKRTAFEEISHSACGYVLFGFTGFFVVICELNMTFAPLRFEII